MAHDTSYLPPLSKRAIVVAGENEVEDCLLLQIRLARGDHRFRFRRPPVIRSAMAVGR
jgi:hypothetical protein